MNKHIKQALSAAITSALLFTSLSLVASAKDYPDVPSSASYYQAVNNLSNLNIINGYDDGTFKPEKPVKRAEIAKMVILTLGGGVSNAADAAKGRDTQFTDVPGSHWASGYITVAVGPSANYFINGYTKTSFRPEDTVTFVQAQKMLVSALGYASNAEAAGGYPNGYVYQAQSLGISNGLTDLKNEQPLNRAQVAILINNALNILH